MDWAKLRGYRNGENPARWHGHLDHILPAPTKKQKLGQHHTAPPFNFLAAVAEHKAKIISKRIKAALAAAKARGVKLGGNVRGVVLTGAARYAGSKALQARANARAADLAPTIAELRAAGARSLRAIAAGLNARGIPTATGTGKWEAAQVAWVLARLA